MSVVDTIPRYTYNDYAQWQGDWELIEGYPFAMSPAPLNQHQLLAKNFVYEIEHQLRAQKKDGCGCTVLYEADWIISEQDIVRPDISVICHPLELKSFIKTPPVLIVEVFSPGTRLKDRNVKFKLYAQCGVKYYLMADPDTKKVEAFELVNNTYNEINGNLVIQLNTKCSIQLNVADLFTDL